MKARYIPFLSADWSTFAGSGLTALVCPSLPLVGDGPVDLAPRGVSIGRGRLPLSASGAVGEDTFICLCTGLDNGAAWTMEWGGGGRNGDEGERWRSCKAGLEA